MRMEKGIELIISPHIPSFFEANEQLTNFKCAERKEPLGPWGGIIGALFTFLTLLILTQYVFLILLKLFKSYYILIYYKGKAYSQIVMWGAKNLSHAVSNIQFNEGAYEELINVAMSELDKNKSFDKSHRFWAMKKL